MDKKGKKRVEKERNFDMDNCPHVVVHFLDEPYVSKICLHKRGVGFCKRGLCPLFKDED